MNPFTIQHMVQRDDGIGSFIEEWATFKEVEGYLDLVTGTDLNTVQNAFVQDSTHILIIPEFTPGITDKMRVLDGNTFYTITYSDDPMGVHHHNEIYCKYGGVLDG